MGAHGRRVDNGSMPEDAPLELTLRTGSERFDTDDDAWLAQEADLLNELRGEVGGVRRDMTAVPGEKGLVEAVILALGSAGAFKAAAQVLMGWLSRDRTRRIELAWTVDGREEKFVLTGDNIDASALDRLADLVRVRMER